MRKKELHQQNGSVDVTLVGDIAIIGLKRNFFLN
jgi:hypothetical protein